MLINSFKEIEIYRKLINCLMQKGKRDKALGILFTALSDMQAKLLVENSQQFRRFRIFEAKRNQKEFHYLGFKDPQLGVESFDQKIIISVENKVKDQFFEIEKADKTKKLSKLFSLVHQGIENISPYLEVRKSRVSGKTRQIPAMIRKKRQQALAIRWLIEAARKKQKTNIRFSECLASEFIEASQKQGNAIQKRNELHKIAHANRTFLRYRWW
jgi:small subunit ribosomal protein S7